MIKLILIFLWKKKNISRYKLQQLTNWNYKRINALYFSKVKYLTLEEIETLCNILGCNFNELITMKEE